MRIPEEQKNKLIAAVEALPLDKTTIDQWVADLRQDDVSKEALFDIMAGLQAAMATKDQVKDDPQMEEEIKKIDADLRAGGDKIEKDLTTAEVKISKLDKELGDLKQEVDNNPNNQEVKPPEEKTQETIPESAMPVEEKKESMEEQKEGYAQAQHLRTHTAEPADENPAPPETPTPTPAVSSTPQSNEPPEPPAAPSTQPQNNKPPISIDDYYK